MSTSSALSESQCVPEMAPSKPLDETAWQSWVATGRVQDARHRAALLAGIAWASIVGLLAAVAFRADPNPYDGLLRFIVCGGAIVLIFPAIRAGRYALAAAFGAVALLYNPVATIFGLSGAWQRAVVVASFAPFVVSLAMRDVKRRHGGASDTVAILAPPGRY